MTDRSFENLCANIVQFLVGERSEEVDLFTFSSPAMHPRYDRINIEHVATYVLFCFSSQNVDTR